MARLKKKRTAPRTGSGSIQNQLLGGLDSAPHNTTFSESSLLLELAAKYDGLGNAGSAQRCRDKALGQR